MQIVHDRNHLARAMDELAGFGSLGKEGGLSAERPVLIDRFLADATEVDVDAIRDATGEVLIGGVMEHVEEAGVHSGDSACVIPPPTLPSWVVEVIHSYTAAIAKRLEVIGLINVQYAVVGTTVYVIEANPRASRTVPFVAKATGVPLAKVATRVMLGATLADLRAEGLLKPPVGGHIAVKEAVLPFSRFPEVDPALGPEMRSTGEVMGIADTFGRAFYKAEFAAGTILPTDGTVFLSLADPDKPAGLVVAQRLRALGLGIAATEGTAAFLARFDAPVDQVVAKVQDGDGVTAVDLIADGKISFVVNTPRGRIGRSDGEQIRKAASLHRVSCVTTVDAALAAAEGMAEREGEVVTVKSLQEYHGATRADLTWAGGRTRCEARRRSWTSTSRVRVGSVELRSPVMTASGTAGYGTELAASFDLASIGAIVTKSLAAFAWDGNPAPRLHPTAQGMINAVGLQGPGIEYWLEHVVPDLESSGATVIASIWGRSIDDYRRAADLLAAAPTCVVAVEVNLSCPNLEGRRSIFAHDPDLSAEVIAATAGCGRPRWAKLSANTDRIVDVAAVGRRRGCRGGDLHQHDARFRLRPRDAAARRSPPAGAGCPVVPSTRSRCARSTTCTPRCPTCRSSASGASRRVGMPPRCCWPGHRPCRSAPRIVRRSGGARQDPGRAVPLGTRAGHSRHRRDRRASVTAWRHPHR